MTVLLCISLHSYGQDKAFNIYVYDYPDYPEIEKSGNIKNVDDIVYSKRSKHLNYYLLSTSNRVQNTFYYDVRNNVKNTFKIALEVNWKQVSEINIILDKDFHRNNIAIASKGGTSDIPNYLLTNGDSVSTHFLFNRLKEYYEFNVGFTNPTASPLEKEKILNQIIEDLIFNKIKVAIEVRYKGDQKLERYELVARNSGLSFQFQRKVDLSLTYVNNDIIGNVFLSAPFRIRAKRPSVNATDFRWLGDVISFGPTLVIENSSSKPVGVGGFIGLGLSENGQIILGFTGGYLFGTKQKYYGLSYNAIGFIDGLIDLFNGKAAWTQN
ncbi:MAG: hypothetical protein P9L89_02105 [Candidatus Celaenobacter polaris]|nr:hypothetical protein [Candidatus Celaenobacter polaris]